MAEPTTAAPTSRDPHRPPPWLPRALALAVVAAIVGMWVWRSLGLLTHVITIVVIAWFIALAMEPSIKWLVGHGIRRTRATGIVMSSSLLGAAAILVLFGGLFIDQLVELVSSLPEYYADLATWLKSSFEVEIPEADDVVAKIGTNWQDLAPGILGAGASVVSALFTSSAVLLVVYYMASQGPASGPRCYDCSRRTGRWRCSGCGRSRRQRSPTSSRRAWCSRACRPRSRSCS
jgi:predicted PurR-regulated permease PerM